MTQLDRKVCDRARRSRDARFDGKFFIAVTSTRIYCRPICPARSPKDENVRYYATAAAAQAAGFRPCLRCHPEASPGTPAWYGTSSVVSRALRLIGDGALDAEGVEPLADRLGVTARHLRRLFVQHLGATPIEVALTRRVHFAKKLIDETPLPIAQIAFASGFGSLRRFNGEIRRAFSRTPTELRKLTRGHAGGSGCYRFRLAYRPPYDWDQVIAFLAARATPGVERVDDNRYLRTIAIGETTGTIAIGPAENGSALMLEVQFGDPRALLTIVERVRRIFDLGADPFVIAGQLSCDPLLRRAVAAHPGVRTPGAWDPFEITVRAVLGQQISVKAATTIAGRVADRWGSAVVGSGRSGVESSLNRLFPTPDQLAEARLEEAGLTSSRAATLRSLSRAVRDGIVVFDGVSTLASLRAISGIGEWTAQYVAMRALNEPDAFLSGDLILRRMAGDCSARELERRSDAWRPWRAYAVMLMWQEQADRQTGGQAGRRTGRQADKQTGGFDMRTWTLICSLGLLVGATPLLQAQGKPAMANDLEVLRKLNDDYIQSVQHSNVKRFDEILADDFLCSNPDGTLIDKKAFLQQTARLVTIKNLAAHDVNVRLMGDVAIIHARTSYTTADGRQSGGRYTDVWARRNGKWVAVSAHVTRATD